MISNQAKAGFDSLLISCLKSGLSSSSESFEIKKINELPEIEKHETIVLTVSSYLFRLMVMIHFNVNDSTMQHMGSLNGMQAEEMNHQLFHDAIAEFGNLSCGILNRDLGAYFPHLGMSTPNLIGGKCMDYLQMLNCAHIQHFEANVEGEAVFHASLCVKAYDELDFEMTDNTESANTGELELF
jgi:CheY-specific phosphatase CheX